MSCDPDQRSPSWKLEIGVSTLAYTVIERHPRRFPHVCRHPCWQEKYFPSTLPSALTSSSPWYHTIEAPRSPAGDTEQPLARALQRRKTKAGRGLGARRGYV